MDSKQRLLTAWSFKEPDRVPIELNLYPPARDLPGADEILNFVAKEADNFRSVIGFDWGFLGLDCERKEEIIKDVPGEYKKIKRTITTDVGEFYAVTVHNYNDRDPYDYHWEKNYIETLDDFILVAEAKRNVKKFDLQSYNTDCKGLKGRGIPATEIFHPLGRLIRQSNMSEVYIWLITEKKITEKYLKNSHSQILESLRGVDVKKLFDPLVFSTSALEMLTPPWIGKKQFMELVYPYDKQINDAIHSIGGRHRAHCHGNSGDFLELFADMGIDSIEPLEPPPFGNNILSDAKKRVGKRMLLSGNIPTQLFYELSREEVKDMVKRAIDVGAPGGGFTLRTTGTAVGNGKTKEQAQKSVDNGLAFIEAVRTYR